MCLVCSCVSVVCIGIVDELIVLVMLCRFSVWLGVEWLFISVLCSCW